MEPRRSPWKLIVYPLLGLLLGYAVLVTTVLGVLVAMPVEWRSAALALPTDYTQWEVLVDIPRPQRIILAMVMSIPPLSAAGFFALGARLALRDYRPPDPPFPDLTDWMIADLADLPPDEEPTG